MGIASIWCPVLGAGVTQVTDFEGNVSKIICEGLDESTGTCRLKKAALEGGPLARLLERAAENTLDSHSTLCTLRA